ncbi:hypothetical protein BC831DRAFT_300974 [Entophlyctis helioformis]|nr:hypothetical protein BC831DRAFT_300974 [Entophlyctis helioformis]
MPSQVVVALTGLWTAEPVPGAAVVCVLVVSPRTVLPLPVAAVGLLPPVGALVCAAGAACCNVRTANVTADTNALASAAALFRLLGTLWRLAVGVAATATDGCPGSSADGLTNKDVDGSLGVLLSCRVSSSCCKASRLAWSDIENCRGDTHRMPAAILLTHANLRPGCLCVDSILFLDGIADGSPYKDVVRSVVGWVCASRAVSLLCDQCIHIL